MKEYTGPGDWRAGAVTVGAGIQVQELYRLANAQNPPVVVVGGECPVCFPYARLSDNSNMGLETVGLAGGYLQGGGHGPMATFYGMGTAVLVTTFPVQDQKTNSYCSCRPRLVV
jgi:hypothetical protein